MQYFPIFVDGQKLSVLVVGGGEIATRKVELMLKTPADVTVVSPKLSSTIAQLASDNKLKHVDGLYDKSLLKDKQLVFVATENRELNKQISLEARQAGVLANVVDDPELCHFITPSIVDRAPMIFAISSEGKSPVLVRYWRERLETILPHSMGEIATFAGNMRAKIKQHLNSVTKRRNFWEVFFSSSRAENPNELAKLYDELFDKVDGDKPVEGELYIVQGTLTNYHAHTSLTPITLLAPPSPITLLAPPSPIALLAPPSLPPHRWEGRAREEESEGGRNEGRGSEGGGSVTGSIEGQVRLEGLNGLLQFQDWDLI